METDFIRDFIYLDTERVRSFSAQFFKGVPSERTTLGEHQIGGEGSASGKLPFIAEVSGGVNYHYLRSQAETRSLHDYLFAEFFDRLVSEHKIRDLGEFAEHQWQDSLFHDGTFFHVRCPLKIVDYKANVALLEALPELQGLIDKAAGITSPVPRPAKQAARSSLSQSGPSQTQQLQQLRPQIKAMTSLMTQFYGDLIRLKVFPYAGSGSNVLVGSADRSAFRYPPASLTALYGAVIDAGWTTVVQINKGVTHTTGVVVSSTGNQLEDSFEHLVDQFTGLSSMTQGVAFPAVAVTPIAIYREIS
jgi:hypothetical protein